MMSSCNTDTDIQHWMQENGSTWWIMKLIGTRPHVTGPKLKETLSLCQGTSVMPQSHPTTGPVRFLSPVRFLARKAEWSACRNFTSVLFSWSHQARGPVRLDTAVYWWFGWIIRMTPRVPRAVPVRASYGPRTGIFNVFHILRDLYGARAGPARVPYGALTDTQGNWHNQNWQKSRTGVVFCRTGPYGPRTGPAQAVHGLFKISKPVRGP